MASICTLAATGITLMLYAIKRRGSGNQEPGPGSRSSIPDVLMGLVVDGLVGLELATKCLVGPSLIGVQNRSRHVYVLRQNLAQRGARNVGNDPRTHSRVSALMRVIIGCLSVLMF